jgi:hypothetical protein
MTIRPAVRSIWVKKKFRHSALRSSSLTHGSVTSTRQPTAVLQARVELENSIVLHAIATSALVDT